MSRGNQSVFAALVRLTRDAEFRDVGNKGSRLGQFGLAYTGGRKKDDDGKWKDQPVFIDAEQWFGERYDTAWLEEHAVKGSQWYVQGGIIMDQWEDKESGDKRYKLKVAIDELTPIFAGGEGRGGGDRGGRSRDRDDDDRGRDRGRDDDDRGSRRGGSRGRSSRGGGSRGGRGRSDDQEDDGAGDYGGGDQYTEDKKDEIPF